MPDRRRRQPAHRTAASSGWSTRCRSTGRAAATGTHPRRRCSSPGRRRRVAARRRRDVGPFYCPADKQVYIDLGFYDELTQPLRRARRSVRGGVRDRARVRPPRAGPARHEPRSATTARVRSPARCGSSSRPIATRGCGRRTRSTPRLVDSITNDDIADGLDAAAAVGDDRIQQSATGGVDQESWTHGSARQRQKWFTIGYRQPATANRCDTFAAGSL